MYVCAGSKHNFAFAVFNAICYIEHFDNSRPAYAPSHTEKVNLLKYNNNGSNKSNIHFNNISSKQKQWGTNIRTLEKPLLTLDIYFDCAQP